MAVEAGITSSEDPIWTVWTVLRLQMLKLINQKLDFFQVNLSQEAIVVPNTTWTFC